MKRLLAGKLVILLIFAACAAAQERGAAAGQIPQQPVTAAPATVIQAPVMLPGSLKILVLEGQRAVNNVEKGLATPPVIEVRDRDDRPVEAATVVFRLPPNGPSGYFSGEQLSKTAMTNAQGQAIATGFTPNKLVGLVDIHVTASMGSRIGETDIIQTNSADRYSAHAEPPKRKGKWKKWAIIGGVAVAVTVAVVLATRGGSSAASNPTVTITPGPVSIGGH